MSTTYETEIGPGLYDLSKTISEPFDRALDQIEVLLAQSTQREIIKARGVRSGRLLQSYAPTNIRAALESGDVRTRELESDTGYSDVYERGRRDVPAYYGRYVAEKGIEAADSGIENILSEAAGGVKERIERG